MKIDAYLNEIDNIISEPSQQLWFDKLANRAKEGECFYNSLSDYEKIRVSNEFTNRVKTEELKAWYSEPLNNSLFQGTSISSLTIPYELESPINLKSIYDLEDHIATAYINLHDRNANKVKEAILEDVSDWIKQGLYYGMVIGSKLISQAFDLSVPYEKIVFEVDNVLVDPHEITSCSDEIRNKYFKKCKKDIDFFDCVDLTQSEFESSLILADISKPKIEKYKDKILLAPVKCNDIAAIMSMRVSKLIREKTSGRINPKSLALVIYDTDSPYTYHEVNGFLGNPLSPVLPGLTVMGSSGTIDAYKWLYVYRVSLIAQKMMKGSLYSEVHRNFIPFVFFGVLVPRDADILLDMDNLQRLRYSGNFSPYLEFCYMLTNFKKCLNSNLSRSFNLENFFQKHKKG